MMSAGIRSGVNWMRKGQTSVSASVFTSNVLPSRARPPAARCPGEEHRQHAVDDVAVTDDDLADLVKKAAEGLAEPLAPGAPPRGRRAPGLNGVACCSVAIGVLRGSLCSVRVVRAQGSVVGVVFSCAAGRFLACMRRDMPPSPASSARALVDCARTARAPGCVGDDRVVVVDRRRPLADGRRLRSNFVAAAVPLRRDAALAFSRAVRMPDGLFAGLRFLTREFRRQRAGVSRSMRPTLATSVRKTTSGPGVSGQIDHGENARPSPPRETGCPSRGRRPARAPIAAARLEQRVVAGERARSAAAGLRSPPHRPAVARLLARPGVVTGARRSAG